MNLILASSSPRRKELLTAIGLDFSVHPSNFEEKDTHLTPEELALENAMGKAKDIARHYNDAIIIGADTVVAVDEHFLGKPKDTADARRILKLLSGTTHKVITAIHLINTATNKHLSATETTLVTIDDLTENDIEKYINSGEGQDKAAGYAIQGMGSLFIRKIEGDYFNVVGLPIYRLNKMLTEITS